MNGHDGLCAAPLLLEVRTAGRRYLVLQAHLDSLQPMDSSLTPGSGRGGLPLICYELGPLLDPADQGRPGRRHALTVVLRRHMVALLVERAESLALPGAVQVLGPLVSRRLAQPWVLGAVIAGETPIILLDLRRIAADVAPGVIEGDVSACPDLGSP